MTSKVNFPAKANQLFDPQAVVAAFELILEPGQVTELRILDGQKDTDSGDWTCNYFGYFDDPHKLAKALDQFRLAKGVYFIPNPIDPALLARASNRVKRGKKGDSTSDTYITSRRWLLIDADAERPSGISASDAEHQAALELAKAIDAYLDSQGWAKPVVADSGNGGHLLYHIDLPADDDGLVQRCLESLAARFNGAAVKVDQTVFNPARIWKLYGTVAGKGDSIPDRPHRIAKILSAPESLEIVPEELLHQLADELGTGETETPQPTSQAGSPPRSDQTFDVHAFIQRNSLDVDGPHDFHGRQGMGYKWTFNTSPLCDHHDDGPHIIQHASGAITSGCHHNSCTWDWHELRAKFEPMKVSGAGSGRKPLRTDMGNATLFAQQHGDVLRYIHPWDKWFHWTGQKWKIDDTGEVERLAKRTAWFLMTEAWKNRHLEQYEEMVKWAIRSQQSARLASMLNLARSECPFPILHESLDSDPWLFNCENGTIDLRTGNLQQHNRGDFLLSVAPVYFDEKADCPRWCKFLQTIMGNNHALTSYLRRLVGYSLTGEIREHILPIMYGEGANGKSTFVNAIMAMMGEDYSAQAPHKLLVMQKNEQHETAKTQLFRRRFVAAVETDRNDRLSESLVKSLTGGDPIMARRMREDHWQFNPTHKLWMATNHRPQIRGLDTGIWRRIKLIPFTVCIDESQQDPELPKKLQKELPGILNWALMGCQEWLADGLNEPREVTEATSHYRDSSDYIGQFLKSECEMGDGRMCKASSLFERYQQWGGMITQTAFAREIQRRGFEKKKLSDANYYVGISIVGVEGCGGLSG